MDGPVRVFNGLDDPVMTPTVDGEVPERQEHWESIYAENDSAECSWFEPTPALSLAMLEAINAEPSMAVIDVGAGASRLAAALLQRGFARPRRRGRGTRRGARRARIGGRQDQLGDRRCAQLAAGAPV